MPKTKEQFAEIRLKSRKAIMEAALELFANNGYHRTSIAQISKKAGVSKGLMYNYFDNKEDLLRCIITDEVEEGEHLIDEQLASSSDPKEQLQHLIEVTFQMVKENFTHYKLLTALAHQKEIVEKMQPYLNEHRELNMAKMIHLFEELGVENPMMEALFVSSTLDGVLLHYIHMGELYPLEDMKNYMISKFCK